MASCITNATNIAFGDGFSVRDGLLELRILHAYVVVALEHAQ